MLSATQNRPLFFVLFSVAFAVAWGASDAGVVDAGIPEAIGSPHDAGDESDFGLMGIVPRRCPPDTCKRCDLQEIAHQRAGAGAVDCGWSRNRAGRQSVVDCALKQAGTGSPFFAIESLQGIDSFIAMGIVRGPKGELQRVWYDSDGTGGACPCSAFVTMSLCTSTLRTEPKDPGRLTCDVQESSVMLCQEPGAQD